MNFLIFGNTPSTNYPVAFLVPQIRKDEIKKAYLDPYGIDPNDALVLDLYNRGGKAKTPVAEIKEYCKEELVPYLEDANVSYLAVADSEYFKVLTGESKSEANLGYVKDCVYGEGKWKVIYIPNYRSIFYDPEKINSKIAQGINAMLAHAADSYKEPGCDIIQYADYPKTYTEIQHWLEKLLDMNCPLAFDIEAFDLKHYKAGIGTLSICWNKSEGIAFAVDYEEIPGATEAPYGRNVPNEPVRELLRWFFREYRKRQGHSLYHSISYDVKVMIFVLFMDNLIDTEGLLQGLQIMLGDNHKDWDCTKLITYLATNSCAGNELSLKAQAQEYAGNWAQDDIVDITKIPLPQLLQYNLVDSLSCWYTYDKHRQTVIDDEQEEVYQGLFKEAQVDNIQMELTGMPVSADNIKVARKILEAFDERSQNIMRSTKVIQGFQHILCADWAEKMNAKWKKKRMTASEVLEASRTNSVIHDAVTFNPRSPVQLQKLLFKELGLPVLGLTDSKQPSTDRDTLVALQNHTKNEDVLTFLTALVDYKAVEKILGSFIPALENAQQGPDGWWYVFGNFNLGGTVSGRLSSSDPNMQNLPANVTVAISEALLKLLGDQVKPFVSKGRLHLGKLIKFCFMAPPGWLLCGLDFASLEDRISALTTKDPNKLKVYTDGYDGHCLRAFAYFGEEMPDIDGTSVESINTIEFKYKPLRQDSKAPTFALTYQGTYITLMKNCGFSQEKAQMVESRYKELYSVSIKWVQDKLDQASKVGYVTGAFGLRIRTPLLHQVIRGNRATPYEAEAEGRTAGNALGQSWCLLNDRANSELMKTVRPSKFRLDIRPCSKIHDAQYLMVRDDMDAIQFANHHLVRAVEWQDHPDIAHDEVKLGGEFSIFYPTWAEEIGIPKDATADQIFKIVDDAISAKA